MPNYLHLLCSLARTKRYLKGMCELDLAVRIIVGQPLRRVQNDRTRRLKRVQLKTILRSFVRAAAAATQATGQDCALLTEIQRFTRAEGGDDDGAIGPTAAAFSLRLMTPSARATLGSLRVAEKIDPLDRRLETGDFLNIFEALTRQEGDDQVVPRRVLPSEQCRRRARNDEESGKMADKAVWCHLARRESRPTTPTPSITKDGGRGTSWMLTSTCLPPTRLWATRSLSGNLESVNMRGSRHPPLPGHGPHVAAPRTARPSGRKN